MIINIVYLIIFLLNELFIKIDGIKKIDITIKLEANVPKYFIIYKPIKLFDKIKEKVNQGNPYKNLEIKNSVIVKMIGVKIKII